MKNAFHITENITNPERWLSSKLKHSSKSLTARQLRGKPFALGQICILFKIVLNFFFGKMSHSAKKGDPFGFIIQLQNMKKPKRDPFETLKKFEKSRTAPKKMKGTL